MNRNRVIALSLASLAVSFTLVWSEPAHAQTQSERQARSQASRSRDASQPATRLRSLVLSSNASALAAETAPTVQVTLLGDGGQYSRGQATLVLKTFFESHVPESFRIIRERRTSMAAFVEAEMQVRDRAEVLNWMVRYGLQNGHWRIRELHVESANE